MTQIISHPLKTIIFTITFLFLIVLLLKNCIPIPCGGVCDDPLPYPNALFPEKPFNLEGINSQYDDYNTAYAASPPPVYDTNFNLIFSSNRNNTGVADYDFIYTTIRFLWDKKEGNLSVSYPSGYSSSIQKAASAANTQHTEFGPLFTSDNGSINNTRYTYNYLLYSNNGSGNQDIKFIYSYSYYDGSITNTLEFNQSPILNVRFVNSASDDAYPTLHNSNSALYFCSNRGGDFDIYKAELGIKTHLYDVLRDTSTRVVTKVNSLSSTSDDKCPFIVQDNIMVFASNRAGGYGGFDLYYSHYKNGEWTAPTNFGVKINSSANEYRPVILERIEYYDYGYNFQNTALIFSSDREGGKGGFDLYCVGIGTDIISLY